MTIRSTKDIKASALKALVYGAAGAGKTRLCATTPDRSRTFILSAEAGLRSVRDYDIAYAKIGTMSDLREVFDFLRGEGAGRYDWVCLDSISEIAEACLAAEKAVAKDPRRAYGEMADRMFRTLRAFRDLPMSVYMTAKLGWVEDEGRQVYGPNLPGRQLEQGIAYLFDEVFAMHAVRGEDGTVTRSLQTQGDHRFVAKDRSGALDEFEPPHLGRIADKIAGGRAPVAEPASAPEAPASEPDEPDFTGQVVEIADRHAEALATAESDQERECLELLVAGGWQDPPTMKQAMDGLDARAKTRVRDYYRQLKHTETGATGAEEE